MRSILAICDPEEAYARRLMEYIQRKKMFPLQPAAFSRTESLLGFGRQNKIAVLLISEKIREEERVQIQAERAVILREEKEEMDEKQLSVYKYQSADRLLREVVSFYDAQLRVEGKDEAWRKNRRLIGVFSPAGSTGKTSFALVMGQILARSSTALYINLEGFSGLSDMLGRSFEGGLSDLLYYARQQEANLSARLGTLTVPVQNLDVLPPAETPEDIREVTGSRWTQLLNRILNEGSYGTVILDIGPEAADLARLLDFCSVVFMPVRSDHGARIRECEEYLAAAGVDTGKIKKVQLPFNTAFKPGREYCESLVWSELGDFTKRLLKEELM